MVHTTYQLEAGAAPSSKTPKITTGSRPPDPNEAQAALALTETESPVARDLLRRAFIEQEKRLLTKTRRRFSNHPGEFRRSTIRPIHDRNVPQVDLRRGQDKSKRVATVTFLTSARLKVR